MNLKRMMKELSFRIKIRKTLQEASREELDITREETIKEIDRRNKKWHSKN